MKKTAATQAQRPIRTLVRLLGTALATMGAAHAGELSIANPDFELRWDNMVRYNLVNRVGSQDPTILRSPNNDDGDRNFDKGIVSNRLDLLSEFDFVYQKRMGFRVSGAAWYDHAYRRLDNRNLASSNHVAGNTGALGLSGQTTRWHKGASGELLDAFVFTKLELGDMPLNLKLGRHTTYWGESLLNTVHGISYGQSPIDQRKGFSVPGTEAKELFVPRAQLSAQLQVTTELSLAAQYFFKWAPIRYPETGSFLGFSDVLLAGGESLIASPTARLLRGTDVLPNERGDWGVSARWSPDWLDGTFGFFVRRSADIQTQTLLMPAVATLPAATCAGLGFAALGPTTCYINPAAASTAQIGQGVIGKYQFAYGSHIDMVGISLAKSLGPVSFGGDINYRRNMPLASDAVSVLPAALAALTPGAVSAMPAVGETGGARGNTVHGVFNVLGIVSKTALFDSATWTAELTWNHLASVTAGQFVFKGRSAYTGIDKATKNYYGLSANFTPAWYQALPAVDIFMPMSYGAGLSGNSVVTGGGNEKAGSYSIGLAADVKQKYRFDLKYVDFFGPYRTNAAGQISSSAGPTPYLKDRGFVAATFKTTF
ncbi:MAG: DUF1302 domain-containing protein [Pseudomonadota bacterium]